MSEHDVLTESAGGRPEGLSFDAWWKIERERVAEFRRGEVEDGARRAWDALMAERAGLAAEVARLRKALEPFARQERLHWSETPDERDVRIWVKKGDVIRARQALAAPPAQRVGEGD